MIIIRNDDDDVCQSYVCLLSFSLLIHIICALICSESKVKIKLKYH